MKRIFVLILFIFCINIYAQKTVNIAVLPIVGDRNVLAEQLTFLTGKFAAELISTESFRVLDRGKMEYILKEQGFQQTGACNSSECQVQMGQLLGVDFIVSGNLVRFGGKYAFRADFISVATGQVDYSVEHSESGDLEDVYEGLCQGAATRLANVLKEGANSQMKTSIPEGVLQNPPMAHLSTKRKIAIALWGGSLLAAGGGYYFDNSISNFNNEYNAAYGVRDYQKSKSVYNEIQSAKMGRTLGYGFSIGSLAVGLLLWFLPEGN